MFKSLAHPKTFGFAIIALIASAYLLFRSITTVPDEAISNLNRIAGVILIGLSILIGKLGHSILDEDAAVGTVLLWLIALTSGCLGVDACFFTVERSTFVQQHTFTTDSWAAALLALILFLMTGLLYKTKARIT